MLSIQNVTLQAGGALCRLHPGGQRNKLIPENARTAAERSPQKRETPEPPRNAQRNADEMLTAASSAQRPETQTVNGQRNAR